MDNRKTYRAYREKVRNFTAPYPSSGLLSKVKRLFSPASVWNSQHGLEASSNEKGTKLQNEEKIIPFSYPHPNITTSLGRSSNSLSIPGSFEVASSPNKILSEFFQKRGDEPLTEVEYEGIVSLISKSRTATPRKVQSSESLNLIASPTRKANVSSFKGESELYSTPYTQQVLKNVNNSENTTFATPDYNPVYHTVNDSYSNIPSIKRVYQFSGLPSPYRTRIRAPSLSGKPSARASKSKPIVKDQALTTDGSSQVVEKPKSEAANALLSILDGTTEEDSRTASKDIKRFANPYSSQSNVKRSKVSKPVSVSSNDIKKTLSFDKSEPIRQEKPIETELESDHKTIPDSESDYLTSMKEPLSNGTSKKTQVPTKKTFEHNFGREEYLSNVNPNTTTSSVTNPAELSYAILGKQTSKTITVPENILDSASKAPELRTSAHEEEDTEIRKGIQFEFPDLAPVKVVLNEQGVQQYKNSFSFDIRLAI